MAEEHEEDRGLLDDDDGGGGDENAALFLVGTMWIIDNRGRRKVTQQRTRKTRSENTRNPSLSRRAFLHMFTVWFMFCISRI
jgi:hypothetical protein